MGAAVKPYRPHSLPGSPKPAGLMAGMLNYCIPFLFIIIVPIAVIIRVKILFAVQIDREIIFFKISEFVKLY